MAELGRLSPGRGKYEWRPGFLPLPKLLLFPNLPPFLSFSDFRSFDSLAVLIGEVPSFCVLNETLDLSDCCWDNLVFSELPNFFDSFWPIFCAFSALPPFPLLLLFCWALDLGLTAAGRLGGRNGAREGAGIQWPIFPSFCPDEGREREDGGIVDFDGLEKPLVDFGGVENSLVDFVGAIVDLDSAEKFRVNFEGEEKSRACSVAGLG